MKAHIKNQQATIDGQVFEAPGIEDGWYEVEVQTQYLNKIGDWTDLKIIEYRNLTFEEYALVMAVEGTDTRQILVKQEGEEKAETVEEAFKKWWMTAPMTAGRKDSFIAGANWQSTQQSKRIAELEGALREATDLIHDIWIDIQSCEYLDVNEKEIGVLKDSFLKLELLLALKGEGK